MVDRQLPFAPCLDDPAAVGGVRLADRTLSGRLVHHELGRDGV